MQELCRRNSFAPEDIASAIFTATADLDAMFPSQAARCHLPGWEHVALLDLAQLQVAGSLPRCIRVLVQINTDRSAEEIRHVYLRGACQLRPDRA